jgi:hypothetical protein
LPGSDTLSLKPWVFYWIKSSGELRVYDSVGRVTGLVDGTIHEEIPDSIYDEGNSAVVLFSNFTDSYCEVRGTAAGQYGLEGYYVAGHKGASFTAAGIRTEEGSIHRYAIDWTALEAEAEGVHIEVDNDGDGVREATLLVGSSVSPDAFPKSIQGKPAKIWPYAILATAVVFGSFASFVILRLRRKSR